MTSELYLQKAIIQLSRGLDEKALESLHFSLVCCDEDIISKTKAHCILGEYWFVHQNYDIAYENLIWISDCAENLEKNFDDLLNKEICEANLDTLEIGTVTFPTGTILACDPLIELEDALPYIQNVPSGTYPVTICVSLSEYLGDRYACVKVAINENKPLYYDLGVVGNEDLDEELEEDEYFGFFVDAGMGCILDVKTQEAFQTYWKQRCNKEKDIDPYNDLFCDLLEENYTAYPKYQREGGDWLNWTVPETDLNIPIFASGWGDGVYPTYFGYDAEDKICGVYILFFDVAEDAED